jgi:hypothetical protein
MTSFLRGCLPGDRPILRSSLSWLGFLALFTLSAGCDIPTDLPKWEQRWIVPAGALGLGVEALLPPGSTLNRDSTLFLIPVDTIFFFSPLGDFCPPCVPLWGLRAPKPAFQGEFRDTLLSELLVSAETLEGTISLDIRNGFNFDPIRPDSAVFGEIVVSLREGGVGGAVLDRETVDGEDTAFPPGTGETLSLVYSGRIRAGTVIEFTVDSPEGDTVRIDIEDRLSVTAALDTLQATSAVVKVRGRVFQAESLTLNTGELEGAILDRVQAGSLVLETTNPWGIAADLDVSVLSASSGTLILKEISMPGAAATTLRVEFTLEEIRSILAVPDAVLSIVMEVGPGANDVTVTPDQELTVNAELDLVLSTIAGEG